MKSHKKKMIAPVVVTVLAILYYIVYFALLVFVLDGVWKYLLGIIPFALAGVMIYVCVQRLREIQEGEEDDLSQY